MKKRRQNGEGTIYQRPNGLWVAEITLGYDENKKRIKKTLSSMNLETLKKKINDTKYLNDRNMVAPPTEYTVADWVIFWLENYKKQAVKPTTYDMYRNAIDTYIKPRIGHYKLDKLNTNTIQKFINDLSICGKSNKGLSTSSLKKINITLSQSYQKAIDLNMLYSNPCKNIIIPKKESRKALAFTEKEQAAFLNSCTSNTTFENLFSFAFYTGMRMGELLALTWDDIDIENNIITVNKNLTVVNDYTDDDAAQKTIINTTKTDSGMRNIPLNKKSFQILKNQKQNAVSGSPFVFSSKTGTPLMKRNIYRSFNNHLKVSDIQSPLTFHSIRHSFATRLLEKGADIKTVSELLGHKSIQITLDIYSHVSNNLKQKTLDLLD